MTVGLAEQRVLDNVLMAGIHIGEQEPEQRIVHHCDSTILIIPKQTLVEVPVGRRDEVADRVEQSGRTDPRKQWRLTRA